MAVAAKPVAVHDVPEIQPVPERRQDTAVLQVHSRLAERSRQGHAAFGQNEIGGLLRAADPVFEARYPVRHSIPVSGGPCRTPRAAAGRPCRYRPSRRPRTEEHTSELQALMAIPYAVFCL